MHLQMITPHTMDVKAAYVDGYIWEAVVYVHIMWILYQTELIATSQFAHMKMACGERQVVTQWD